MDYVYLGKIVNTHGIKGELRLISDFDKKEIVFQPNFPIYIGKEKQKEIIHSYRPHKNFDMIVLKGYDDINQVIPFLKKNVYVKREDLKLTTNDYLLEDLINCQIFENKQLVGKIIEIVYNKANILLKATSLNGKTFYIPHHETYIKKVDLIKKAIECQNIQGLIL